MLHAAYGRARRPINITISSDQVNFNLYVACGSPVDPVDVVCVIEAAATLRSNSTGTPAFRTGTGWASGSAIRLVVNGKIHARGANGGTGGSPGNGTAGGTGGDAIELGYDLSIDNTNGYIRAGGGGGGGGAGEVIGLGAGTGGGGGGGQTDSAGGPGGGSGATDGAPGTDSSPGTWGFPGSDPFYGTTGRRGGVGGAWGANGGTGVSSSTATGGPGGAPGKAVKTNGFSINWQGGNNSTQVKGAIV
jgi:hypothetical protein